MYEHGLPQMGAVLSMVYFGGLNLKWTPNVAWVDSILN